MSSFGIFSMKHDSSIGVFIAGLTRSMNFPAIVISRLAWHFGRLNRSELKGASIVLHRGLFTARVIHLSEICRWSNCLEMGFYVVSIDLGEGGELTWVDNYGDLLSILRQSVPSKEVDPLIEGAFMDYES